LLPKTPKPHLIRVNFEYKVKSILIEETFAKVNCGNVIGQSIQNKEIVGALCAIEA
jgi:hypothetical protein